MNHIRYIVLAYAVGIPHFRLVARHAFERQNTTNCILHLYFTVQKGTATNSWSWLPQCMELCLSNIYSTKRRTRSIQVNQLQVEQHEWPTLPLRLQLINNLAIFICSYVIAYQTYNLSLVWKTALIQRWVAKHYHIYQNENIFLVISKLNPSGKGLSFL